jgi:hypothetical protein
MKVEGKNYCDTSKVYVAPIAKSIAKDIIVDMQLEYITNQKMQIPLMVINL